MRSLRSLPSPSPRALPRIAPCQCRQYADQAGAVNRDIFISHSSKDKAAADAVCAALERHGIGCWIAPRDIVPGTDWSAAIVDGLIQSPATRLSFFAAPHPSPP